MVGRQHRARTIRVHQVRQAVQGVVGVARRAKHHRRGVLPGHALPVAHLVIGEAGEEAVRVRHGTQPVVRVVAVEDALARSRQARRLHRHLVAGHVVVVGDRTHVVGDRPV